MRRARGLAWRSLCYSIPDTAVRRGPHGTATGRLLAVSAEDAHGAMASFCA